MKATTHLLEYRPYPMRNECCAIGFLALLPDGDVRMHLAENLRKVKHMHPACDLQELRERLDALARELRDDRELLALYLSSPVGPLAVCPAGGAIRFESEDEYQMGVQWTLAYMVNPTASKARRERPATSRLFVELKTFFAGMGWLAGMGDDIRAHRIVPRYSLSQEEGVSVDFALLNSSMHYLQTADFRTVSNVSQKRQEVQSKWFALGLAPQLLPAEMAAHGIRRYAVVAGTDTDEGRKAMKVAVRVSDNIFAAESHQDMEELAGLYAEAMGQDPLVIPPTRSVDALERSISHDLISWTRNPKRAD